VCGRSTRSAWRNNIEARPCAVPRRRGMVLLGARSPTHCEAWHSDGGAKARRLARRGGMHARRVVGLLSRRGAPTAVRRGKDGGATLQG
jgi:hypothetical protein